MTDKKLYCPKGHVIHNLISDEFLNHKELGKDRIPISFKKGFCVKCMLPYWEWQCTNTQPTCNESLQDQDSTTRENRATEKPGIQTGIELYLLGNGWSQWYHKDYWINKDFAPKDADHTNCGMTLFEAYARQIIADYRKNLIEEPTISKAETVEYCECENPTLEINNPDVVCCQCSKPIGSNGVITSDAVPLRKPQEAKPCDYEIFNGRLYCIAHDSMTCKSTQEKARDSLEKRIDKLELHDRTRSMDIRGLCKLIEALIFNTESPEGPLRRLEAKTKKLEQHNCLDKVIEGLESVKQGYFKSQQYFEGNICLEIKMALQKVKNRD